MDDLRIRAASVPDAAALAAVYRDAYRENRELGFPAKAASATASDVSKWVRESQVRVATTGGRVVGGVRLEVTDPGRVKLSRLAVHRDWQGRGVGGRLLDHAESHVGNLGHETVWLTTPEDHPYLPEIYRARGYEVTGPYPLEYRDYDEVVMEKRVRWGRERRAGDGRRGAE